MRHAFTLDFGGLARVLTSKVKVSSPISDIEELQGGKVAVKEYIAIWDTGATSSTLTQKVVTDLNLQPTGIVESRHAAGKSSVNTYLVCIVLPNGVVFRQVRVSEVKLIPDDNQKDDLQPQLLIGMDIIGAGDFAVTNFNGKTTMTFRLPSCARLDFVPDAKIHNTIEAKKHRRPFRGFPKGRR